MAAKKRKSRGFGRPPRVSKETVLTALRTGRSVSEISKLYSIQASSISRWKKMDENFLKEFNEIVDSPLYKAKRKAATKGRDTVKDEEKPRWSEAFVAYYKENEGRIMDACRHVGISLRMFNEARDPSHPSYEPWFAEAIEEANQEHDQALQDELRVQAKKSPTLMRYVIGAKGLDEEEGAANIDDSSILAILKQLMSDGEGSESNGSPTGPPEQVPQTN